MKPSTDLIICAVDLSQGTELIILKAVQEAWAHRAGIHLIHVLHSPETYISMPTVTFMGEERFDKLHDEQITEIRALVSRMGEEAVRKAAGIMGGTADPIEEIHVHEGEPVAEILDKIRELKADMLVMGTHGKGFIEQTFLGSVAYKLVKRLAIPVLLVPLVPPHKT